METLIIEIKKEIELLESWIDMSTRGGWSTHLNAPMRARMLELKEIVYDLTK